MAGAGAGSAVDTEAGTAACTEAVAEHEVGSGAVVWPLRATWWRRLRRRWRSPVQSG